MSESPTPPDEAAWMPLLRRALDEDRAQDDVTTKALLDEDRPAVADLVVKAPGVVCGLPLVAPLFQLLDDEAQIELLAEDGDTIGAGTKVLTVSATAGVILRGERTALNILQRLSGVATLTAAFAERAMGSGARIYDTRKTTPGWRALEKYAVACGGGANHRLDLADAAMIKENHLVARYGDTGPDAIKRAIRACRERLPEGKELYVEVENHEELEAAVAAGAGGHTDLVIMLDDFDLAGIRKAVAFLRDVPPPRPQLEITGGVTLERVGSLAATGVRRLSTGSLTHSAVALDMSLKIRRS